MNIKEEFLICFESGHYKSFKGAWKGDSIWTHFIKDDGTKLHFNKEKIEYIQSKSIEDPKIEKENGQTKNSAFQENR